MSNLFSTKIILKQMIKMNQDFLQILPILIKKVVHIKREYLQRVRIEEKINALLGQFRQKKLVTIRQKKQFITIMQY